MKNILTSLTAAKEAQVANAEREFKRIKFEYEKLLKATEENQGKPLAHLFVEEFSVPEMNSFTPEFFESVKELEFDDADFKGQFIDFLLKLELIPLIIVGGENYGIYRTEEENSHDCQIVTALRIDSLLRKEELFFLTATLIMQDLQNKGPLYNLSLKGQENLNLPYLLSEDEAGNQGIKSVWLERFKLVAGEKRKYHLHNLDFPRDYKKANRHFMVLR